MAEAERVQGVFSFALKMNGSLQVSLCSAASAATSVMRGCVGSAAMTVSNCWWANVGDKRWFNS